VRKWFVILISLLLLSACAGSPRMIDRASDEELLDIAAGVGSATILDRWDGTEYWFYTSDNPTVAWDIVPTALAYELKIVWLETDQEYNLGVTTQTQVDLIIPRVGHYKVMARACKLIDCDDTNPDDVSTWADSTDVAYASVDGQPGIWRLHFEIAPPSW